MDFGDFTLFNIFQKDKKIYMICSILNIPINESDINVNIIKNQRAYHVNNFFYNKIEKDNHEPILILIYNIPDRLFSNELELVVSYKENIYVKNIKETDNKNKQFLALTTLFKDDYNLIPIFYNYYKSQGVDHFYLYYNGKINQDIKDIINNCVDKTDNDITLLEWDFRYYNNDKIKYEHHAQMGQMHDALYRFGKGNYEYMIFNDLDEYFKIPNCDITLKEYIEKNKNISIFGFCNRWSVTIDEKIPSIFPKKFFYGNKHEHGDRSKNIFKIENIETIGIHGYSGSITYNVNNPLKKLDLDMYHFYNWNNKDRKFETLYTYTGEVIEKKKISQKTLKIILSKY